MILPLFLFSLVFLSSVNAQGANNKAPELTKEAVGNVNQVRQEQNTQNQAEAQNLRAKNTVQEQMPDSSVGAEKAKEENEFRGEMILKNEAKSLTMREAGQIVREKNNDVANQVQSLLMERFQEGQGAKGGVGERVRVIAQEQLQAQEEIENRISRLEERPAWRRFFFGQEKDAVIAVNETLEQQTKQLDEWRELLKDPNLAAEDRLAIEETILDLQAQQDLVETHVDNILGEFNVAGFFRRLFGRS